jgi:hypothetical protein
MANDPPEIPQGMKRIYRRFARWHGAGSDRATRTNLSSCQAAACCHRSQEPDRAPDVPRQPIIAHPAHSRGDIERRQGGATRPVPLNESANSGSPNSFGTLIPCRTKHRGCRQCG